MSNFKKEDQERIATTAAHWWAEKLKARVPHDNGDRSCALACALADVLAVNHQVSEDQLHTFEEELKSILIASLEAWGGVTVYSDYGPGGALGEAAQKAGINSMVFPYKTGLTIMHDGSVLVHEGYGQTREERW